jgi:hypothetical protein
MSTRLIARTVLSIVGTVSMVLAVGLPYRSTSAAATWVEVRAPFNGYWDRWGWSPPSTHNAYGADWATDYYQVPNANGYWYPVSSGGDSVSTRVSNIYNNCGGASWTYAGISYNFEVTNGSGTLGYFQWAHVYPTGSGFSWWASVPYGTFIGYTYSVGEGHGVLGRGQRQRSPLAHRWLQQLGLLVLRAEHHRLVSDCCHEPAGGGRRQRNWLRPVVLVGLRSRSPRERRKCDDHVERR